MKKIQTTLLSMAAVALLAGPNMVKDANAGIRVRATVKTPNVRVYVGNTPSHYRVYTKGHQKVQKRYFAVSQRDRTIARRLAWYTGESARKMLRLRHLGFGWNKIGHRMCLPRRVVRAAMHQRSWNRFIRKERRFARRGIEAYPDQREFSSYDDNDFQKFEVEGEFEDDD